MDWFDDIQIEEFSMQDFVDEVNSELFEEEMEARFFQSMINSNYEF